MYILLGLYFGFINFSFQLVLVHKLNTVVMKSVGYIFSYIFVRA